MEKELNRDGVLFEIGRSVPKMNAIYELLTLV
jgi:hypothetical protein